MRIYKNKFYVLESTPGISGFKRWDEREYHIVKGTKAANHRLHIVAEWTPMADEQYAVEDGHLPEHQPIGNLADVMDFLDANPYQSALAIGKAAERLHGRHSQSSK